MSVQVYLNFNGNCREAVEFYTEVFGAEKQQIMTYGDVHSDSEQDGGFSTPKEAKNLIMHTFLYIDGSKVMFSDTFPGMSFTKGNNISLAIVTKDKNQIETIYNKLKEGGQIEMELQETFWSKSYASLVDKFGIGWQLSLESE